eukprot:GHVU01099280.1.p1 GENE.GHVU01099280.1~~GHVU01099280.1.p1  ORF type:complete len:332 (+),score=5.21 GHVU01099280.1:385-1380(+)
MKTIFLAICIFRLILAKGETAGAPFATVIGPPQRKDRTFVTDVETWTTPVESTILTWLQHEETCSDRKGSATPGDRIVYSTARKLLYTGFTKVGVPSKEFGSVTHQRRDKAGQPTKRTTTTCKMPIIKDYGVNAVYLRALIFVHLQTDSEPRGALGRYIGMCGRGDDPIPQQGGAAKACQDFQYLWSQYSLPYTEVDFGKEQAITVSKTIKDDAAIVAWKYFESDPNAPKDGTRLPKFRIPTKDKVRSVWPRIPRTGCVLTGVSIHSPSTTSTVASALTDSRRRQRVWDAHERNCGEAGYDKIPKGQTLRRRATRRRLLLATASVRPFRRS